MSSLLSLGHRGAQASRDSEHPKLIWALYGLMGALLAAYLGSLIILGPRRNSLLLDGWMVVGFELIASFLCIAAGLRRRQERTVPLLFGFALLSWTIGTFVFSLESIGGRIPPQASMADVFWIGFYPLAYFGMVMLMLRSARELVPATWLDGAVTGLGAAAVVTCFGFTPLLHEVEGSTLGVVTNLAYPIGDVLLLVFVLCGFATMAGRPRAQWVLLSVSCLIVAAGDTAYLLTTTPVPPELQYVVYGISWPAAILLISASTWLPSVPTNLTVLQKTPGFLLPGLSALAAFGVLLAGTQTHVGIFALAFAAATLGIVGVRVWFSMLRLRQLTQENKRQSVTDQLTGLGNRRHLFNLFDSYFVDQSDARKARQRLDFLFVDLDHFKEINDSFGHAAGDEILRKLGPRLKSALGSDDVLVRLGGDEFGVVIMDAAIDQTAQVARRLIERLGEPFLLDTVSVRISASIGAAGAPKDAADGAGLLVCADLAMYRAKSRESKFETYRKEIDADGSRLRLGEELTQAVKGGDLILHYQPQLDLRTGEIGSVEALLRWPHPRLGLVPPLEFLPLAEEAGLMQPLTALVLEQALTQCRAWWSTGCTVVVAINISVSNLLDPEFVDLVRSRLSHYRLPASALIVEITETSVITDFERCKVVIARLRDMGIVVSIDDFGAGFTSLAYLGDLAVGELKLDRTFITRLRSVKGRDLALVRATVELAHTQGLRVVAEGIEDSATLDLLTGIGCDVGQGYFIGRPAPSAQLTLAANAAGRLAVVEPVAS
jgi:diguanylate cyclase